MSEFSRIARYFRPLAAEYPGAQNLQDDAARLDIPPGYECIVSADAMVAGIHFFPDEPPENIAAKLLRVNYSDLAAKGARPGPYFLTLALPDTVNDAWVEALATGLAQNQAQFGGHLAGGDSVRTPGPITLSLTVHGFVASGKAVWRTLSHPADTIYVSGTIGDAALGLKIRQGQLVAPDNDKEYLLHRLLHPTPRLDLQQKIQRMAAAALDISDGLMADLDHLCRINNLRADILWNSIPRSPALRRCLARHPEYAHDTIIGGEDYELCILASHADAARLAPDFTRIGTLKDAQSAADAQCHVYDENGEQIILSQRGWDHFR